MKPGEEWWISPVEGERGEVEHVFIVGEPRVEMGQETGRLSVVVPVIWMAGGASGEAGERGEMWLDLTLRATKDDPEE
jgi:hypothetical protein